MPGSVRHARVSAEEPVLDFRYPLNVRSPVIADPGNGNAIPTGRQGVCSLTSAGAETRTLGLPQFIGQRLTIAMDTDGGDAVLTVSQAINAAGNTVVTFNDAGDFLDLVGITVGGALRWRAVEANGVTLA